MLEVEQEWENVKEKMLRGEMCERGERADRDAGEKKEMILLIA